MQVISTRVHGILDYLTGALLIVAPWLFGFATGGVAQWLPVLLGAATIGMSLLTRYEYAVLRVIPLRAHLAVDVASGLLLALSPWLFGFAAVIWWPHLLVGLTEIVVPLLTRRDETAGRGASDPGPEFGQGPVAARERQGAGVAGTTAEGVHALPVRGSAPSAVKDATGAAATEGTPGTTDTGVHRLPLVPPQDDDTQGEPDGAPSGSSVDRRG